MEDFFSKFQSCGIKIDRVNSMRVANPLIFFNILQLMLAKWRHHELSLSLRWVSIYLFVVNIPWVEVSQPSVHLHGGWTYRNPQFIWRIEISPPSFHLENGGIATLISSGGWRYRHPHFIWRMEVSPPSFHLEDGGIAHPFSIITWYRECVLI